MAKKLMVVRGRAIFLLLLTTFVMIVMVLLFSFYMIHQSEQRASAQAAEYTLQNISASIEHELGDLASFAYWSSRHSGIVDFLTPGNEIEAARSIGPDTWTQLSQQYISSRNGQYVWHLLVFNTARDKLLQAGNSAAGTGEPITTSNLNSIFSTGARRDSRWWPPIKDPYTPGDSFILPLVVPVYSKTNGTEIGTVFLAAGLDLVLNKFRPYISRGSSRYYIAIGERYFRVDYSGLVPEESAFETLEVAPGTVVAGSTVHTIKNAAGKQLVMVKFPLAGISYVEVYPASGISLFRGPSVWLISGLGVLVLMLGFLGWSVSRMTWELSNNDIIMKELEYEAYMDPLTGICTRKHFVELASVDITRAQRQHQAIYAAMLDLDFFKDVNDNYDHSAGDMMLRASAEVIRQTIRSYDLLGRYGGEEFSLLITALDEENAQKLMERIRENIEQNIITFEGHLIKITCSIGLAKFTENDTLETALRKADKALYAAKNSGRNKVVVYEAPNT